MTQAYSNPDRENDPHANRKDFPLAGFNSRDRQAMLDAIIEGEGIKGGWFYQYCFPGCLPDSFPFGPFDSREAALKDAQDSAA